MKKNQNERFFIALAGFSMLAFAILLLIISFNPDNTGMSEMYAAVFFGGIGILSGIIATILQNKEEKSRF